MEDCENPGSSVTRLGERLQSKRIINLGAVTRERRLVSLRTLRQNVVESKRTAFLDRLMRAFTDTSDDSVIDDIPIETDNNSITTIKSLESIQSPLQASYDDIFFEILSERNKQNYRNVMGILTVHEFLLATEMVIREEAIALKNSLMFVRPEGSRVLIIVVNNRARVYRKNGFKCTTFKVAFTKGPTVLDCIVNDIGYEKNKHGYNMKYYVLDVLVYNGYSMAHSDTECRTFFIKSRLEEAGSQYCNPSFVMLTYNECTPENMRDAYYQLKTLDYETDSIVFVDRAANYVGGYNPNWLCWRDANTSKYCTMSRPGPIHARIIYNSKSKSLKTLDDIDLGPSPHWIEYDHDKVLKVLIKNVNLSNLSIEEISLFPDATNPTRLSRINLETADSHRKIIRRFILENQADTNPEDSYNRLIDAVVAVDY